MLKSAKVTVFAIALFLCGTGYLHAFEPDTFLIRLNRASDLWNRDSLFSLHQEIYEEVQLDETPEKRILLSIADFWLAAYYWDSDRDSSKHYLKEMLEVLKNMPKDERTPEDWTFIGYAYSTLIPLVGFLNAPIYSRKSAEAFDEALKLGDRNPRVHLLKGIVLFYTPKMFRGGAEKALQSFDTSLKHFDDDRGPVKWGKRVCLIYQVMALKKLGRKEEAIETLKGLLAEYPENSWARSLLKKWEGD